MKFDGKRLCTLLLILLLLPIRVSAAENPYVLYVPKGEGRAKPYWYASPFMVDHTILRSDGSQYYSGTSAPLVYRLAGKGDEDGISVAAYCADPASGVLPGTVYRRMNLEDSSYFDDATAGRLRSVILHGYPLNSVQEIQEAANQWLQKRELPELRDLQSGEAILAAQIAIWKLTGKGYTVHALYAGQHDLLAYRALTASPWELNQTATSSTPSNVESLYTYFMSLSPQGQAVTLACDSAISRSVYSCTQRPDGAFDVSVSVSVQVKLRRGEKLWLQASVAGRSLTKTVTKSEDFTFQFTGLSQRSGVTLELYGLQYGEDVFLFDADADREDAQTMIGWHSGSLPVYCRREIGPVSAAGLR